MIKIKDVLASIAPNGKPTSAVKLLATITDLEKQLREAMHLVAGADARANELLIADRDKEVDQLEADVRHAQRTIDKIEVVLPGLRERLATAQAYEKRSAIARYQAKLKSLVEEQERAVKACLDLNSAIDQVRLDAFRELGGNVAQMVIPDAKYHGMLNPLGFEAWKKFVSNDVVRAPKDWANQPAPAPRPVAEVSPMPAKAPVQPDASGNIEILVVGSEPIENGPFESWVPGTRVIIPKGFADEFVRQGRAEYVAHVPAKQLPAIAPIYPGGKTRAQFSGPPRPQLPAKPPEGFRRVMVLRSGYHDHEDRPCEQGIEIDLPEEIAGIAEMHGAVQSVELGPKSTGSSVEAVEAPRVVLQIEHRRV